MAHSQRPTAHGSLLLHPLILKRETYKSTVVEIAATVTVLLCVVLCGIVVCYWWHRKSKRNNARNGYAGSSDGALVTLHDRSSKTPLMQLEEQHQAPVNQSTSFRQYEEQDADSTPVPGVPRRTMSVSTSHSLPPSYAIAVRAGSGPSSQAGDENDLATQHQYRSNVGASRSGGPRPLMLSGEQQSSSIQEQRVERGRSRSGSMEDRSDDRSLAVTPERPAMRPRASSRFREEDVDE